MWVGGPSDCSARLLLAADSAPHQQIARHFTVATDPAKLLRYWAGPLYERQFLEDARDRLERADFDGITAWKKVRPAHALRSLRLRQRLYLSHLTAS